jgi:hypothetical protein
MGVKVAFREEVQEQASRRAVLIPRAALRKDEGRDVVFVVSGGEVEKTRGDGGSGRGREDALVLAGIAAGESVVVEAPADLADGDEVEVREK